MASRPRRKAFSHLRKDAEVSGMPPVLVKKLARCKDKPAAPSERTDRATVMLPIPKGRFAPGRSMLAAARICILPSSGSFLTWWENYPRRRQAFPRRGHTFQCRCQTSHRRPTLSLPEGRLSKIDSKLRLAGESLTLARPTTHIHT